MPPDDPSAPDARREAPPDASDASDAPEEPLPPLLPFYTQPKEERPLPRGCHPLVFGVVMATLQFAATFYFMPSCFHGPG